MAKLDLNIPDMTLPDGNKIPFVRSKLSLVVMWRHTNAGVDQIGYGLGTAW